MSAIRAIAVLSIATVVAACEPSLPENTPVKEARWLQQNWSAGERYWFHHTTQGTSTLPVPYVWFVALERPQLWLFGRPPMLKDSPLTLIVACFGSRLKITARAAIK